MALPAACALAVAAALATLLGWGLTAWRRQWPPRVLGLTLVLAAAAMLLVSTLELIPTAVATGLSVTSAGALVAIGGVTVIALHLVAHRLEWGANHLHRSAMIVAIAIGVHNIPEGAAPVGAALLSVEAGVVTAIAVGLHNIPEGIAVSAPVLAAGGTRLRAFVYTCIATGGEITGAMVAVLFAGTLNESRTAALLAFVAGIMVMLSLVELGPAGLRLLRNAPAQDGHTTELSAHPEGGEHVRPE